MKAILLAGGKGTRLRPLTIHTPKPIVPIFDRPFLNYQLDLLKHVPEIDEVVLSLNYQPRRIEEIFGDGSETGLAIHYVVEPAPLGTGGAIRYAGASLRESVVVFNGDVLTQVDLAAVIALHRERKAKATIVLTPVENPSAYGLVETDGRGNIQRFLEKPKPDEINLLRAWVLANGCGSAAQAWAQVPHVDRGYWIDIGTPEKYMQVHRDVMDGRYKLEPFASQPSATWISPSARIEEGAIIEGPCFLDDGVVVKGGARIGPYSVIGRQCHVEEHATVEASIVWANSRISQEAVVRRSILGRHCHIGRNATLDEGVVLGDKSSVTDYSRL